MTVNEEGRQAELADELVTIAQKLAHSTRTVPRPSDSYELLGSRQAAQDALAQVYEQLATWHGGAIDGMHYNGKTETACPVSRCGPGWTGNRAAGNGGGVRRRIRRPRPPRPHR